MNEIRITMMAIIRTKLFIYLSVIIFFSQGYSHGFLFLESPLFGLRHNVFSTKSAKWHRTYGNPVLQTRHLLANFDEGSSSSSSSSSNAPKAGTRKILNWNLQELLSHPPMGMSDPRLIHLMDVYNAATSNESIEDHSFPLEDEIIALVDSNSIFFSFRLSVRSMKKMKRNYCLHQNLLEDDESVAQDFHMSYAI